MLFRNMEVNTRWARLESLLLGSGERQEWIAVSLLVLVSVLKLCANTILIKKVFNHFFK